MRCTKFWVCTQTSSRWRVQADGGSEVVVEGQEVWGDWMRQTVADTRWKGGGAVSGEGASNNEK